LRIIPAIDIIDGKCVRLTKGQYNTKKIYNENPLEIAKTFEDHGIRHLHLVDLDGAKSHHIVNYKVLEQIASKTNLAVDFGGGLKSDEDLRIAFESGAQQITGGSIAVKQPTVFESWLNRFGSERIILGADCNNEKIAVSGWQEESDLKVLPFIKSHHEKGVNFVICTDIAKDGMLEGPSIELYSKILKETPHIKLIASGGVSTIEDLQKLKSIGCEGAILGKAIYENRVSLKELLAF
jgi:phosphoribosylformimino-5-aminoimidazole carboxamide ribotide isomerase